MNNNKWFTRPWFYIAILFYFFLGYTTLGYGEKWASMIFPEDHYFENVGAISLAVASVLSFYVFIRALKTRRATRMHGLKLMVYLGLALLYFFGAGEEISWGQRIFNIQEPASLQGENVQDELNIHNLAVFENSKWLKADTIFTVFWMCFAVLLPWGALLWERFGKFAETLSPIVDWHIGILFLLNFFGARFVQPFFKSTYTYQSIPYLQAVQEVKESNYEFLFIFLSLIVLWELNQRIREALKS
ncbi:MAG: hypothetical protein HZB18_12795 [Chloroflexi bacterium]|nr:hypothetical protein [Chloroflexota bacterium]